MKKKLIALSAKIFPILLIFLYPAKAYAQPPRFDGLVDVFHRIIQLSFPVAVLIALGMVIYAGYMIIMSAGDPQKLKKAQGTITWVVIALAFMALTEVILLGVVRFLET
ncbi:hypothetical protein KC622_00785 [Candidatus Dojkabacteria bacterium]|uniref:TrbC/VIRB2 family protein n=1 Tax=Candidatus Dojkabacteria bacterium TaxID=2099670 RepID=A0A955HXI1_9BACT|nr:hypothetical protein [Candidatus Dojkabacteria bacterium]MCB9791060.1 hypothetical protein [Candidatus Nomurabacteria bacterium]